MQNFSERDALLVQLSALAEAASPFVAEFFDGGLNDNERRLVAALAATAFDPARQGKKLLEEARAAGYAAGAAAEHELLRTACAREQVQRQRAEEAEARLASVMAKWEMTEKERDEARTDSIPDVYGRTLDALENADADRNEWRSRAETFERLATEAAATTVSLRSQLRASEAERDEVLTALGVDPARPDLGAPRARNLASDLRASEEKAAGAEARGRSLRALVAELRAEVASLTASRDAALALHTGSDLRKDVTP